MRLLLINLPSGETVRKPEEHCGLGLLKAYINLHGIDVDILDAYAGKMNLSECEQSVNSWIQHYKNNKIFIGISPFVTSHSCFIQVGKYIKDIAPDSILFAGGHYASLNKEYFMTNFDWLDAIVVGEGENSLLDLLNRPFSENIPGVYKRNFINNFIIRERIKNLDELPFQARYLSLEQLDGQPFSITTSRGCYGECSFCSISSFYKLNGNIKQTFRSAKSVSDEIHFLVEKYKVKSLKIVDDNFFRNESDCFLDELIDYLKDLKISFRLSARPNDITEDRAIKLKKMGVVVVGIGVESSNNASLKLFNKGLDITYSERAIQYLKDNQITCLANFIMFDPIIDLEGIKNNCKFVKSHVNDSLFHRINSHLWIRATDPLVKILTNMNLCEGTGFPYINCRYRSEDVVEIRKYFDLWCQHDMKEYYKYADILMAKGIYGNELIYEHYKTMLKNDIIVLEQLISLCQNKKINEEGLNFIQNYMDSLK